MNIIKYMKDHNLKPHPFLNNSNRIDIGNEFTNNIDDNIKDGNIIHMKQIINLYNKQLIYSSELINKTYNLTFDEIVNITINTYYNTLSPTIYSYIIAFIGIENKGFDLIKMIEQYMKIQNINIIFCIKKSILTNRLICKIKTLKNIIIFISHEYGNDIVPSLLVYYKVKQNYKIDDIIKLHTKSKKSFYEMTEYLLNKDINQLKKLKNDNSNVICLPSKYINMNNDPFNKLLYEKHKDIINKTYFCAGTIFYIKAEYYDQVLNFMIKYYKNIMFNNTYDPNYINKDHSYIHFMERLFGLINNHC